MATKNKAYAGARHLDEWEAFTSAKTPTNDTHGHNYIYVVGPFHTLHGAVSYVETKAYKAPSPIYAPSYRAAKEPANA